MEPGRLALITFGPCAGKMCTIVDIVDQKRVVVDGPESITGVKRHMMPVKRLSLTDFCASPQSSSRVKKHEKACYQQLSRGIKVKRGCREKTLKKARESSEALRSLGETRLKRWCRSWERARS